MCTWVVLNRYGKMIDMETTALKEKFITHNSQRMGHDMPCRVPYGGTRVGQGAEGARQKHGQSLYHDFCRKEGARQVDKLSKFRKG